MAGTFETQKGKGGFRFNLKAPNGKVILSSETYKTRSGAENGIASVKANARDKSNYEERKARDGQSYFVLKAGNGEIIGRSETYKSSSGRKHGIDSVKRNAGRAKIKDKT
jgi:uncharacterized protein YegP (UPF0339 family)